MKAPPRRWLGPASLVGLAAILLAPGLWLGPWADNGVFLLIGVRVRSGGVPYRDVWDHKPPGAFLIDALGQLVTPGLDPWLSAWLLSVVATAVAAVIVHRLLSAKLSPRGEWAWSTVCVLGMAVYPAAVGGGYTETYALPLVMVSLWIVSRRRASIHGAAAVGFLLSLACLVSLQCVPPAIALGFGVIVLDRRTGTWQEVARRLGAFALAGLVVPVAILVWLMARGATAEAVDQLLAYNSYYRAASSGFGLLLAGTALYLAGPLVPAMATMVRMVRNPAAFDRLDWLSLAWGGGMMAYLVVQSRFTLHYFILLAPPLVILAATGFDWVLALGRAATGSARLREGLVIATVVGFAFTSLTTAYLGVLAFQRGTAEHDNVTLAAAWIQANTPAGTTLFVWGDDTSLYLRADRPGYDAYVYQFPMVTQGYWSPAKTQALLEEWTTRPPQLIAEGEAMVPLFGSVDNVGDSRTYDTLDPLRNFVRDNYRDAGSAGFFDMYVLSGSG
jgi:hypothetical protein